MLVKGWHTAKPEAAVHSHKEKPEADSLGTPHTETRTLHEGPLADLPDFAEAEVTEQLATRRRVDPVSRLPR